MGNPVPVERVVGPNRNNMENYGGPASHGPKYEAYIMGPEFKTFLLASSLINSSNNNRVFGIRWNFC